MFAGTQRRAIWLALRQFALFIAALCLGAMLVSRTSQAVDAVDLAVDAFAAGGAAAGIPITEGEKKFVKPLVRCIADGKPVVDCTKEAVIAQLPAETRTLVDCITGGKNVAQCAENEVIKRLPPQSRELANCIASGTNVAECGQKFATTQAEKAVFETVNKYKLDSQDKFKEATSGIQNIVNVVDGIVREDWQKVLENGGKAVAKYVVKAVLTTFLTSATTYVLGPVVDTIIDNRFDLVKDLVNALQSGDFAALPRILGEAYLTSYVEVACALIPAGAVKEAICGTLGKVIGALGGVVGDIAGAVVGVIEDILGFAGGLFEGIGKGLAGKDSNCGRPQDYYATNTLMCYNRAAYLKTVDPAQFDSFENDVYHRCRRHFIRCEFSETVTRICEPMRNLFKKHTQDLHAALNESANAYARSRQSYMEANRSRICSPQFFEGELNNFINGCEGALKKSYPLNGDAMAPDCKPDPKRCAGVFGCSTASAQQAACRSAADGDMKRTTAEVCKGAGKCFMIETAPKNEIYLR